MRIAIDAMGGDHAPGEIVRGAAQAAREGIAEILLFGDEARIRAEAPDLPGPPALEIRHTDEYVGMDEHPSAALKKKKRASVVLAAQAVRQQEAHGMISAGNTGALLEAALLHIGRIRGIKRPALATLWPTIGQHSLLLDSGANADCKAEYLLQFAQMGAIYAELALGRKRPTVGLINIGEEEGKGNALTREAYELLGASGLNFTGNIEPRHFLQGKVDVAVCDGYVGNLVLKTGEGVAEYIFTLLKQQIKSSGLLSQMCGKLLRPTLLKLRGKLDHSEHGGALFLGVQGVCVKSHGRAEARTIYNATRMAAQAASGGVVAVIGEGAAAAAQAGNGNGD